MIRAAGGGTPGLDNPRRAPQAPRPGGQGATPRSGTRPRAAQDVIAVAGERAGRMAGREVR